MGIELPGGIRFGRDICGDLVQAERREWWLANGRGGYAAGTIAQSLTRRYHGLLIAPLRPSLGRVLVWAKADAVLEYDGLRVPLSTNRWGSGVVDPAGHVNVESFWLDGRVPVWRYRVNGCSLEHRIWMEHGADTTYCAWRLVEPVAAAHVRLVVHLLVNARDHHGGGRPWDVNPLIECDGQTLRVAQRGSFDLHLLVRGGSVESRHDWYDDFDLPVERERGLPDRDSHLCAGVATLELSYGEWVGVVGSLDPAPSTYFAEALRRARARDEGQLRRARVCAPALSDAPEWIDTLVLAADSFVFARPLFDQADGESLIAGYPWFGDWGRDTMIALPGIALATGAFDVARRILATFSRFVDRGMLPNVFPEGAATPEYNTADAALWFVEAWRAYVEASGDTAALREAWPVLCEVVDWHVRGTRFGIGMDAGDALLKAGEPGVQVTWMDAKLGDWVVTPRIGKPVEINALWFNALMAMCGLAGRLSVDGGRYEALAARVRESFAKFHDDRTGALVDVVDGPDGTDFSLRPNQIIAVSLGHSPISTDRRRGVLDVCERTLLTSFGLRSLDPGASAYRGKYVGGVWERDGSYHQGPVWAWLLGHFALAHYRVHGDAKRALAYLDPLRDHLCDGGLGNVSEIFDGAPPHVPRGAPCQAWSVACALEAWSRIRSGDRSQRADPQAVTTTAAAARTDAAVA